MRTDERVERLATLLEQALALPTAERTPFLERACAGDAALLAEITSLLDAWGASAGWFEALSARVIGPVPAGDADDAEDALIGQRVGNYEVLERVAVGGMGVVYRARDPRLDRFVALKFLPTALSLDDTARARLQTEARSASALEHPNIGAVYDVGEHADRPFLVFAWYDGDTVKQRLGNGPLPMADVLSIATQMAAALATAHRAGIVHRDVKPSNVIVTRDDVVKLVDFGIARAADSSLTRQGTTLGTCAYMSPEQTRGAAVDARADVWSFGVVLYEMLTARRPFPGDTDAAVIYGIRNDPPQPVARLRPDTPPALANVVAKCLAKDPAHRYTDAAAVLEALAGLADADGITAERVGTGARGRSLYGRTAALAAIVIMLLAGLYVAISPGADRADRGLAAGRVLVVPLENHSGDASLDPVGSIAADLIIGDITRAGLQDVVPVTAALTASRYVAGGPSADTTRRTHQLASETGAGIVVSGAYYVQRDSLYLHASITDVMAGDVLGGIGPIATALDAPLTGIVQLREQLLSLLAPRLLPGGPDIRQWATSPPPFEAYRAFALGLELFVARQWQASIARFAEATRVDSSFTPALIMAGLAHGNLGDLAAVDSILDRIGTRPERPDDINGMAFDVLQARVRGDHAAGYRAHLRAPEIAPGTFAHWGLANSALWVNRPRESVRVALELDPERGELRGWFFYWRDLAEAYHRLGRHREELSTARRARELFPGDAAALQLEVRALAALGRMRELERLAEREIELTAAPEDLLLNAGLELRAHGQTRAGDEFVRRSLEKRTIRSWQLGRPRLIRAKAHYILGEHDEAERLTRAHLSEFPESLDAQGLLGVIAAARGDEDEALAMSRRLKTLDRAYVRGVPTWWRARIAAVLGRPDDAVQLIEQAWSEGMYLWRSVHVEPDLDSLRTYPPFVEFITPKG